MVGDNSVARGIIAELKSKNKKVWEDPQFPADGKVLYPYDPSKAAKCVSWKRPGELHPDATVCFLSALELITIIVVCRRSRERRRNAGPAWRLLVRFCLVRPCPIRNRTSREFVCWTIS